MVFTSTWSPLGLIYTPENAKLEKGKNFIHNANARHLFYTKAENVKFHTPEKSGKKYEISLVNNVCSQEAASF